MTANVEYRNKNYSKLLQSVESANPDILILQEFTHEWKENTKALQNIFPYCETNPQEGGSGLGIFSRYKIEEAEFINLDNSVRQSFICEISLPDTKLSLFTIHPSTPMNLKKFRSRNTQFIEAAKIVKNLSTPKILIGDFNNTMWSPYFADLVKESGLQDVRKGRGIYGSWISFIPSLFRIPIDHCLVSNEIFVEKVELGNPTGSDHLPLLVSLRSQKN